MKVSPGLQSLDSCCYKCQSCHGPFLNVLRSVISIIGIQLKNLIAFIARNLLEISNQFILMYHCANHAP